MIKIHPEYIVDEHQKTKAVILPYKEWEHVLDAMEELDDIHAYDKAKSHKSEPMPFSQAVKEIK